MLCAGAVLLLTCASTHAITSDQVRNAISKGVALIRAEQGPAGEWRNSGHRGGVTALCVLALLNAGAGPDDPAVAAGLAALDKIPNQNTYVVGLKAQCYAAAGAKTNQAYFAQLKACAEWLIAAQNDTGMWSYGKRDGRGDNSNTQFALLGLHEANNAGVAVPKEVWERSSVHFQRTQCEDGGWDYQGRGKAYGSMTAAGVASLYICGQKLYSGGQKALVNGAYPDCGKYKINLVLAGGLDWMGRRFSATENPGKRAQWFYYYMYGMERCGMLSGQRNFGANDWYRQGADTIVAAQKGNGGWGELHETAMAVLFLVKGNRPVLVQKLQWRGDWNRNIHDVENFIAFVGDKLGKTPTWQTASLDLPLEELRQSPILYITGHSFPVLTAEERKKLRDYAETGGTLLADACCGSKEFAEGFRAFAKETFPEYRLEVLPESHPVFRSYKPLDDRYGLEGIDVGCRTSVFFSPNALSCLWEMQDYSDARKKWSEHALSIGLNIAAYATGKELLKDKLDRMELPAARKPADGVSEVPRGAVQIARLIHDGEYNADVHAMVNLAAMLRDKAKADVVAMERPIKATDEHLYDYPVLFMTGHFSFKFKDDELAALRQYVKRGGVIVADACCGRAAFDKSFREFVRDVCPDDALKELAPDHAIYAGMTGVPLGELRYRKILAEELKARGAATPPLEAVTIQGRTAVLYSKYDFSCALENDSPYSCRGYTDDDGKKLAMSLFLFAVSY
jgi:hypothetical protein